MAQMLGREEQYLSPEQLEELGTRLISAARDCCEADVAQLLKDGAPPDFRDSTHYFWTAAHWGARHNSVNIIRSLYETGANLALQDRPDGWYPVHVAAKYGCLEVLDYLARKDVDIHSKTTKGMTVLHWSAAKGHLSLCDYVGRVADEEWEQRQAAISVASRAERVALERLPSLDVNATDVSGFTPLHEAAVGNHLSVCRWLHETRGASLLHTRTFSDFRPTDTHRAPSSAPLPPLAPSSYHYSSSCS